MFHDDVSLQPLRFGSYISEMFSTNDARETKLCQTELWQQQNTKTHSEWTALRPRKTGMIERMTVQLGRHRPLYQAYYTTRIFPHAINE